MLTRLFKTTSIYVCAGLLFVFSCSSPEGQEQNPETNADDSRPLNVILMIGDGMGLSQVSASLYYSEGKSNFERFPVTGLSKTSSMTQKITDSAAGATALSTGEKTYNGAIGVDSAAKPLTNIVEILSDQGYKTGLVSTSSITHATPASFYAKAKQRSMEEEIAAQLPGSDVDFFAGGGLQFFNEREDAADIIADLESNGFQVQTEQLFSVDEIQKDNKYGMLLAKEGMPKMIEGRGDFLPQATQLALDYLSQSDSGFFLMVEGSQIDWGGHANDAEYLIGEQLDFDKTIGVALDFAEQNGNTLVIVTADHETGGFTLASKEVKKEDGGMGSDYDQLSPTFSTGGHSATMVPVFAFGPDAEGFTGIYENTGIFHRIRKLTK